MTARGTATQMADGSDDTYVMANANRCTALPQHVMVNQGRDEALYADVYRCVCGESRLGNSDEVRHRLGMS